MGKETAPRPEFCAAEFCAKVCAEVCAAGVFVVEEFAAGVFVAEECTAEVRVFKVMGARMFCAEALGVIRYAAGGGMGWSGRNRPSVRCGLKGLLSA